MFSATLHFHLQAAVRVSGLELGGLAGSLVAGGLSDWLIRNQQKNQQGNQQQQQPGSVGLRVRVCMAYAAGLAAALAAFQALPATAPPALQWLSVAAIGFCIYGPQMMIGLCGAELVHPDSVGASQGVLGWVAYLGAANAGGAMSGSMGVGTVWVRPWVACLGPANAGGRVRCDNAALGVVKTRPSSVRRWMEGVDGGGGEQLAVWLLWAWAWVRQMCYGTCVGSSRLVAG